MAPTDWITPTRSPASTVPVMLPSPPTMMMRNDMRMGSSPMPGFSE